MAGKYILCLCEGNAEIAIMQRLLEHDLLPFQKEDLIEERFIKRTSVKNIQRDYLNRSFDKPVYILRIIDSRTESFELSKAYQPKISSIYSFITRPEIEILIIIAEGDYQVYTSSAPNLRMKPSSYCKYKYRVDHIKSFEGVYRYFSDIRKLVTSIETYHGYRNKVNSELTLKDLIENTINI